MGLGGGAPSNTTSTTTTTQELSPEQRRLLKPVIPIAEEFVKNPPQQYPGSAIAPFDPLQQQAQQAYLAAAAPGSSFGNFIDQTQAGNQFLLGPVLYPQSNPALQSATEAAIRPITQNFTQSVLPNIRGGATGAGQYGGSRQGIAEGLASQSYLRQVGDTSAQLQSEAYGQGLDAFTRALYAAPQTAQLSLLPPQIQEAVGLQRQQQAQQQLSETVSKFVNEQIIPFAAAQDVAALAFGIGGGSATATSTGNAPVGQTSPFQGALGGAGLGATVGSAIPGVGTALGAGIGALAGLLLA